MSELPSRLNERGVGSETAPELVSDLESLIAENGYTVVEKNDSKPWGASYA
jgi:hypothetical protein